jgi:trans-aconitate methyltransferase
LFAQFAVREREALYSRILSALLPEPNQAKILEIGAGSGSNIPFFQQIGFSNEHIWANELLPEKAAELRQNFPEIHVHEGDARNISAQGCHLIFQSTVYSSILSDAFRKALSEHLWTLLAPGGFLMSYDFAFNNPRNPDVKKLTVNELRSLFPEGKVVVRNKVTLAPPIGRRVGKTYPFFNLFPFLRTHRVVVIQKNP